jgi:hypothetical protein
VIRVFACSLAISAGLVALMVIERAGVPNPFELRIVRYLSLYQDLYAFAPYIAILFLALVPSIRALGTRAAEWCGEHPRPLAALATLALAAGALYVCQAYPLTMDEYTVVFQSKIFAAGHLTGRFPPELVDWLIPKAIQGKFLKPDSHTGAVAAAYWPGFSLLLTPFMLLGLPWLLNPLIGGATVLVMHRIGLELFGERRSAGLVVLLTLASSAVTLNAMTYYTMPAHLLASALYVLLLLRPTARKAFFAGIVGSCALVLHSPVPHLLFALPWIVWLALQAERRKLIAALIAGYLPLSLLLGFGWATMLDHLDLVTQSGRVIAPSGIVESILSRLRSIQDWGRYETPSLVQHTLVFAKLWLWAVPALLVAAALGAWRLRRERIWQILIASALLTYVGYQCLPIYQGHGWGYRYFHQAWLVLPLLAAGALRASPRPALSGYLAGSAVLSLALLTWFQALQIRAFVDRHLAQLPPIPAQVRVVNINPLQGYYAWDLAQNDPFLRNPVLLLISQGERADREMMARVFPDLVLVSEDRRASLWGPR